MVVTHVLGCKGQSRQNFIAHSRKEKVHLGASHWAPRGKEKGGERLIHGSTTAQAIHTGYNQKKKERDKSHKYIQFNR